MSLHYTVVPLDRIIGVVSAHQCNEVTQTMNLLSESDGTLIKVLLETQQDAVLQKIIQFYGHIHVRPAC